MPIRICPECQADLTNWSIRSHSLTHWPEDLGPNPAYAEARRRQAILTAWAEEQRRAEAAALPPLNAGTPGGV